MLRRRAARAFRPAVGAGVAVFLAVGVGLGLEERESFAKRARESGVSVSRAVALLKPCGRSARATSLQRALSARVSHFEAF